MVVGDFLELGIQQEYGSGSAVADGDAVAADLHLRRIHAVQGRLAESLARLRTQYRQAQAEGRAALAGIAVIGTAVVAQARGQQIVLKEIEILVAAVLHGLVGKIPEDAVPVRRLPAVHQRRGRDGGRFRFFRRFEFKLGGNLRRLRRGFGGASAPGKQAKQKQKGKQSFHRLPPICEIPRYYIKTASNPHHFLQYITGSRFWLSRTGGKLR